MASTISREMKVLLIWVIAETPLNLLATVSGNGGNNYGSFIMPLQNLSCFYVMAEAAIAQTTTFLRRIYRNWQLKSVLKLE